MTGVDRDQDFIDAEREEPGCIMAMTSGEPFDASEETVRQLVDGVTRGQWSGRASQLSEDHVEWSFIDEVARATEDPGRSSDVDEPDGRPVIRVARRQRPIDARALLLQRRSAVAFDGRSTIDRVDLRRHAFACRA